MAKALVLLSGGLDSMLAAKVLMEQGIEVTGLSFRSYFFNTAKAKKVAEQLGIKFIEIDFSDEHLAMVKNPKHGYGRNINPCVDCHGLMLKKAREIMVGDIVGATLAATQDWAGASPAPAKGCYDFIATGEVLGERPMSQNPEALKMVEKISGLEGRLLRPLSAKLLAETEVEKNGLVKRHKLLEISGRSRKQQLELVKMYGIKEYASPGGGCLLTDPAFSEKLMKILEYWPECGGCDIELLKRGRVFWLKVKTGGNALAVIGRNEKDNENLEKLARAGDIMIKLAGENGPTSITRIMNHELGIMDRIQEVNVPKELKMGGLKLGEAKSEEEIIEMAALLTGYYATKARGRKVKVGVKKF